MILLKHVQKDRNEETERHEYLTKTKYKRQTSPFGLWVTILKP